VTEGTRHTMQEASHARFGALVAHGVDAVTHDARELTSGFWAVVLTFEGELTAVRMTDVRSAGPEDAHADWPGLTGVWSTSLDEARYVAGVEEIRRRVAEGTVYQVNLCRVLEHELPEDARLAALGALLRRGNPAPYAATVDVPEAGLEVACASPEAFLVRRGDRVTSRPIKGTGTDVAALLQKDYAENVMIVDLVRNDLAHVCRAGTVEVESLCGIEQHPGLVHLVSDVSGLLTPDAGWPDILAATFPPGSVSGAPKHTALQAIADLEPAPRGPYCGAVGWVDADNDTAELAVGIRTFWAARRADGARVLRFGTGAGITWASDPGGEWAETQLKAARLVGLAAGSTSSSGRLWS
jgi:para-aminobenzoate synthetase component 1